MDPSRINNNNNVNNIPRTTCELIDRTHQDGEYSFQEAEDLKRIWNELKPLQSSNTAEWDMQIRSRLGKIYGPRADTLIKVLRRRTDEAKKRKEQLISLQQRQWMKTQSSQLEDPTSPQSTISSLSDGSTLSASSWLSNPTSAIILPLSTQTNPTAIAAISDTTVGTTADITADTSTTAKATKKTKESRKEQKGSRQKQPGSQTKIKKESQKQEEPMESQENPSPEANETQPQPPAEKTKPSKASKSKSKAKAAAGAAADTSAVPAAGDSATAIPETNPTVMPDVPDETAVLMRDLDEEIEKLPAETCGGLRDVLSVAGVELVGEEIKADKELLSALNSDGDSDHDERVGSSSIPAFVPIWAHAACGKFPIMPVSSIQSLLHHLKVGTRIQSAPARSLYNVLPKFQRHLFPCQSPFIPRHVSLPLILPRDDGSSSNETRRQSLNAAVRKITPVAAHLLSAGMQWFAKGLLEVCVEDALNKSTDDGYGRVEDLIGSGSNHFNSGRLNLKLAGVITGPDVRSILLADALESKKSIESISLVDEPDSDMVLDGHSSLNYSVRGKRARDEDEQEEGNCYHEENPAKRICAAPQVSSKQSSQFEPVRDMTGVVTIDKADVLRVIENTSKRLGLGVRSSIGGRLHR